MPKSINLVIGARYDFILIIIERLTKYIILVLFRTDRTIKDLVYVFLREVVLRHRLLDKILSDRDKLFISKF